MKQKFYFVYNKNTIYFYLNCIYLKQKIVFFQTSLRTPPPPWGTFTVPQGPGTWSREKYASIRFLVWGSKSWNLARPNKCQIFGSQAVAAVPFAGCILKAQNGGSKIFCTVFANAIFLFAPPVSGSNTHRAWCAWTLNTNKNA